MTNLDILATNHVPRIQPFTVAGDGTGDTNHNGNYALTPRTIRVNCPTDHAYAVLLGLSITIADQSNGDPDNYGGGPSVANGYHIAIFDGSGNELTQLTPTIQTNANLTAIATRHNRTIWNTVFDENGGDWSLTTYIDFNQPGGVTLPNAASIRATLNDNFTLLTHHRFTAFGYTAQTLQ